MRVIPLRRMSCRVTMVVELGASSELCDRLDAVTTVSSYRPLALSASVSYTHLTLPTIYSV